MMPMVDVLRKVIWRVHYPLQVMLVCVRWYAAYPLNLRHIEEMMGFCRDNGVRASALGRLAELQ
jgi:transposase-like protein